MADKSTSGSSEGVNNNNKPAAGGTVDDGGPKPVTDPKLLALSEKTGYPLLQENGQRIYGPPPNWQGAPPPRGCEIFVGKIPRDCMEDELVPIFEKAGRIYEIRLMMDFNGANRGYCFVTFTSRSEAKKAVREINEYEIRSKKYLGVCLSVDNCRLFVGGIPREKKSAEILEEMKKIAEGVVSAIVYPSIADKTKNRGFAFVEFESHRSAAMARRKLMPGRVQMFNQPIAVDWAEPEPEVDEDVMSKVRILYVRNLMLSTQEETLEKAFSEGAGLKSGSGGVERVKKIKDYAFIHFKERGDAVKALAAINGTEIEGSRVEVVFAKPVDKETQSNRHHNQHNKIDMQVPGYPGGYSEYPGDLQLPHHYLPGVTFYPQPFLNGGGPHMGVPPVYNNNISSANQMRDSGTAGRGSGIRGRSAAGTRAAGGGVKNYQPRNNANYRPFSSQDGIYDLTPGIELVPASAQNNKSLQRSPAQMLEEICQRNGWGSPNYHLHQALSPPGPQGAPTPQLFLYKVHIPGYSQNPFMPNKLCRTMDEARRIASEFTLHKLGQGYQYQGPYSTSGAPGGVNPSGPHPPSMGYHSYPYGSA